MKKKFTIYSLIFCVFYGCQSQPLADVKTILADSNKIILIFKNFPKFKNKININPKVTIENTESTITCYDGMTINDYYPKINDTLFLKPNCEAIILKHNFNTISSMDFIFQKGDTIQFSYEKEIPIVTSIGGPSKAFEINYEKIWRNRIEKTLDFTAYEIYRYPYFSKLSNLSDNIFNNAPKIKQENYISAKINFENENIFLDSLRKENKISNNTFNFYSNRAKYLNLKMGVEQGINLDSLERDFSKFNSNSCMYTHYYDYVQSYVKVTIEDKAKIIRQSNGQIADYKEVFDKVSIYNKISKKYKDLLLIKYLELIGKNFEKKDFLNYVKKAQIIITDSILLSDINSRFMLDYWNSSDSNNNLYYLDKDKNKNSFADIIKKNKGKLIYVDFWASWCSPCRATMQSSKKLRSSYKNILFVYISIDKDFTVWKKANNEEELYDYQNSFILINEDKSSLLKNINLTSIPRYLLFNKKGKLINSNAPNPDSKELIEIINKNL